MSMAATLSTKTTPSLDILVVEDQPDLLASIRDALGKRGHRVTAALDGQQALDRLDGRRFDVAICDARIPRPDELELLRRLRRHEPDGELILMNASTPGYEKPVGLDDRALHHLTKPFDLERLMSIVGRVAEQRRAKLYGESPRPLVASPMTSTPSMPRGGDVASTLDTKAMSADPGRLEPLVEAIKHFERGYLLRALNQCDWQRTRTAGMLGISRKTLWQKLKQHRIAESETA
jgi:DNA-binding NtrC family response regulator